MWLNTYATGGEGIDAAFCKQQFDDILTRIHRRNVQYVVIILKRERSDKEEVEVEEEEVEIEMEVSG